LQIFLNCSARFDITYYIGKQMPMVKSKIGDLCVGLTVESGLAGGALGSPATYVAIGALLFESIEVFGAAIAEHGADIMAAGNCLSSQGKRNDRKQLTDVPPVGGL
jgi:hypothetical protein